MNMQNELIEAEINKNGLRTILVPTDFSEYSDMALRTALEIAKQQNASIYLLHVTRARQTTDEKERMQAQIDKFPHAQSIEIVPDIRKGIPYKEILKIQAEKEIDLIVIASQDTTKSLPFLKRGMVEKVMKKAKCSVMVIGR
jgi:nucleotide-binding universal stress UspA family protein